MAGRSVASGASANVMASRLAHLLPRIDLLPRLAVAGTEIPIVEHDRAEAGASKRLGEGIRVHLLHGRVDEVARTSTVIRNRATGLLVVAFDRHYRVRPANALHLNRTPSLRYHYLGIARFSFKNWRHGHIWASQ